MDIFELIRSILATPEFSTAVLTAFAAVVSAAVGYGVTIIRKYGLGFLNERELTLTRQLAVIAVQYVEQVYKDADGPAKLESAMAALDDMLAGYGIQVRAEQLRAIVEAAVYAQTARAFLPETTPPE